MMGIMQRLFLFIICALSLCVQASNEQKINLIAMAAADGTGSSNNYLESFYGPTAVITQVPIHHFPVGLGQDLLNVLNRVIIENKQPFIYHAACAGTATGLYYAVNGKHRNLMAGMVLDGPLSIPNAAIHFRSARATLPKAYPLFANTMINNVTEKLANTTFGKYVYPQLLLPVGYCAFKESPLEAVARLENKELPIVIVEQHTDDHAVPPAQAHALYYKLKEIGCKNIYLMQPDNATHVDLLNPQGEKTAAIRRIMQGRATETDKALYQPDHQQFKNDYAYLIKHDRQVRRVAKATMAAMLCGIFFLAKTVVKG